MPKRKLTKPTEAEIKILDVLWRKKSATVREVYEILSKDNPIAYTTTLKQLQVMTEKGLVKPDKSKRTHTYQAKIKREDVEHKFAGDLINLVFGGSMAKLFMRVLESEPASQSELDEIKRMIDRAEEKKEFRK